MPLYIETKTFQVRWQSVARRVWTLPSKNVLTAAKAWLKIFKGDAQNLYAGQKIFNFSLKWQFKI